MNTITESELREIWQNGKGQIPVFPLGTRFSMAAQEFIKTQHLQIEYASPSQNSPSFSSGAAEWDIPGTFPVVLSGPLPVCAECGQTVQTKPEHFTQIDALHYASKTTPRLIFRGRVDSLHALVLLTSAIALRFGLPELAKHLDTLAAYCREIMSAEYNHRQVAPLTFMGKNEEELHKISHWPDRYLGIQHLTPGNHDHEILHWLNVLRSQCREVEISALQAFPPDNLDSSQEKMGLSRALNRLSSAIYVLELYFQVGDLSWKVKG